MGFNYDGDIHIHNIKGMLLMDPLRLRLSWWNSFAASSSKLYMLLVMVQNWRANSPIFVWYKTKYFHCIFDLLINFKMLNFSRTAFRFCCIQMFTWIMFCVVWFFTFSDWKSSLVWTLFSLKVTIFHLIWRYWPCFHYLFFFWVIKNKCL